jgi:hypothetical protein
LYPDESARATFAGMLRHLAISLRISRLNSP